MTPLTNAEPSSKPPMTSEAQEYPKNNAQKIDAHSMHPETMAIARSKPWFPKRLLRMTIEP